MKSSISPARISNASRGYNSGNAAAAAIGISPVHFHRLCKEYGIETPAQRRQREKRQATARATRQVEERRYREHMRHANPTKEEALGRENLRSYRERGGGSSWPN